MVQILLDLPEPTRPSRCRGRRRRRADPCCDAGRPRGARRPRRHRPCGPYREGVPHDRIAAGRGARPVAPGADHRGGRHRIPRSRPRRPPSPGPAMSVRRCSCTSITRFARTPRRCTDSATSTTGGCSRCSSAPTASVRPWRSPILSVHSPMALRQVLATDDVAALCLVPGVGRKTAARLLVELKSRLDAARGAARRRPRVVGRGRSRRSLRRPRRPRRTRIRTRTRSPACCRRSPTEGDSSDLLRARQPAAA